jgi:hypothetical protein
MIVLQSCCDAENTVDYPLKENLIEDNNSTSPILP